MPHNSYTLDNEHAIFNEVFVALSTDPTYAESIALAAPEATQE